MFTDGTAGRVNNSLLPPLPIVADSLLDRLVNTSHKILMVDPATGPETPRPHHLARQHPSRPLRPTRTGNYPTDDRLHA